MIIKLKISRPENCEYFRVSTGEIVNIDIEDYLCGVVPAEMGSGPIEALMAQAIAARTYALPYATAGKTITDESSKNQAFRASRIDWKDSVKAVHETAGKVLFYAGEALKTCSFSSSNGGRTVSSEERWGGFRPYLIAQDDPWDAAACEAKRAAGQTIRKGHGVGMSQYGAAYAAGTLGVSCAEILDFYYPGTEIVTDYGKGGHSSMADKIKAADLVAYARAAVGGGYCFGASGQVCSLKQRQIWAEDNPSAAENLLGICAKWDGKKCWDCSGLFRGAWRALLKYRSGGATTIFNTWTSKTGEISTMPNVPGIALFRANETKPSTKEHIGLYVGGGLVVDARGSSAGVLIGTIASYGRWTHWAYLADVDYSQQEIEDNSTVLWRGTVKTKKGKGISIWESAEKEVDFIGVPDGEIVEVLGETAANGFARARYCGIVGVADTQYLKRIEDDPIVVAPNGKKGIFIETDNPEAFLELLRAAAIVTNYIEDDNDNGGNDQ